MLNWPLRFAVLSCLIVPSIAAANQQVSPPKPVPKPVVQAAKPPVPAKPAPQPVAKTVPKPAPKPVVQAAKPPVPAKPAPQPVAKTVPTPMDGKALLASDPKWAASLSKDDKQRISQQPPSLISDMQQRGVLEKYKKDTSELSKNKKDLKAGERTIANATVAVEVAHTGLVAAQVGTSRVPLVGDAIGAINSGLIEQGKKSGAYDSRTTTRLETEAKVADLVSGSNIPKQSSTPGNLKPKTPANDNKPSAKPANDNKPSAKPANDNKLSAKPANDNKPSAKPANDNVPPKR